MITNSMYNGAEEFTKEKCIPSIGGVSGALLSVIPGIGAVASLAPKLNDEGN